MSYNTGRPYADKVIERIDIHGLSLTLKVNHHGPQDYREWSLAPRTGTWLAPMVIEP